MIALVWKRRRRSFSGASHGSSWWTFWKKASFTQLSGPRWYFNCIFYAIYDPFLAKKSYVPRRLHVIWAQKYVFWKSHFWSPIKSVKTVGSFMTYRCDFVSNCSQHVNRNPSNQQWAPLPQCWGTTLALPGQLNKAPFGNDNMLRRSSCSPNHQDAIKGIMHSTQLPQVQSADSLWKM